MPDIYVPLAYVCSNCMALNDPEFTVEYPEVPIFVDDELTNVSSYGLVVVYLDGTSWDGLRPGLLTIRGSALGVFTDYLYVYIDVYDVNMTLIGTHDGGYDYLTLQNPIEIPLVTYNADVLVVMINANTYAYNQEQQAEPIAISCFEFSGEAEQGEPQG